MANTHLIHLCQKSHWTACLCKEHRTAAFFMSFFFFGLTTKNVQLAHQLQLRAAVDTYIQGQIKPAERRAFPASCAWKRRCVCLYLCVCMCLCVCVNVCSVINARVAVWLSNDFSRRSKLRLRLNALVLLVCFWCESWNGPTILIWISYFCSQWNLILEKLSSELDVNKDIGQNYAYVNTSKAISFACTCSNVWDLTFGQKKVMRSFVSWSWLMSCRGQMWPAKIALRCALSAPWHWLSGQNRLDPQMVCGRNVECNVLLPFYCKSAGAG